MPSSPNFRIYCRVFFILPSQLDFLDKAHPHTLAPYGPVPHRAGTVNAPHVILSFYKRWCPVHWHSVKLLLAGFTQVIILAFAWGFLGAVLSREPAAAHPSGFRVASHASRTDRVNLGSDFDLYCIGVDDERLLYHGCERSLEPSNAQADIVDGIKLGHTIDPDASRMRGSRDRMGTGHHDHGAAEIRGNSFEIIDVGGVLSGIFAAGYSSGLPGIFNFNGVLYNVSTGGILPVAPSYTGTSQPAQGNNTGLAFAGGLVPANLTTHFPPGREIKGISSNYTVQKQGLTANVTCSLYPAQGNMPPSSTYTPVPIPLANGQTDYWLWAWNITAACEEGGTTYQQYVTRSNSSTTPQTESSGFVSSFVCPYPLQQTNFTWDRFIVTSNGSWKYDFLPLTVCEVVPSFTTSTVHYANNCINATATNTTALGFDHPSLLKFLAAVVDYQARNTQGLTSSSIGDSLYSIYTSTATSNSTDATLLLQELAQYWGGIIEFSGTFLRSGFSAYPRTIPSDALVDVTGKHTIVTMGWSKRSPAYLYTVLPLTFVALLTFLAIAHSLVLTWPEHRSQTTLHTFDPSNPVHLIMVSSAGAPAGGSLTKEHQTKMPDLEGRLEGFDAEGIKANELVRVQLGELDGDRKGFGVVD
ncbi:hypothetical protein HYDPIDRAFT_33030 [Hydnomerulius pinastri MD-312]|uniref:Uncharacterized protein n=1 Tax=Hydnomerulius pinastri MD-312 TaxID=994086 RepID=A0A0C9VPI1_9AGAM|nr:hypothetical protein HYDPIDRAFT_33030 [Hydnomerulius pinastri MD-312]